MPQHDYVLTDAPGLQMRGDMEAALLALATLNSGLTAPTTTYAGMLWLDTTILPDGQLRMRSQDNLSWINIAGFPLKASSAEAVTGTDDTKYVTPAGAAARDATLAYGKRNRIVNPAMQVSQQTGTTASALNNYYAADQWFSAFSAAGAAFTFGRVASQTPNGSIHRLRFTVTTALASLAAGEYVCFTQVLEGFRTGDFGWGTANAKQVIVRFGFRAPAGTYCVTLRNRAYTYAFGRLIVISAGQANIDTEQVFTIPGATAGVWANDSAASVELWFALATGTAHAKAPDVWVASSQVAATGMAAGIALGTFELFDVGLYLDDDNTGIPPLWEMPDEPTEMLACQRYFVAGVVTTIHAPVTSGSNYIAMGYLPVDMRANPTFVSGVSDTPTSFPATVGTMTINNTKTVHEGRLASATGTGYYMSTSMFHARL